MAVFKTEPDLVDGYARDLRRAAEDLEPAVRFPGDEDRADDIRSARQL